jgi:3-oxoacyl-[acyl-carrier-protein] synthase II
MASGSGNADEYRETAIVVTGIGLVSALGDRDTTWRRLLAGDTAIQMCQPFGTGHATVELPPLPLALVGLQPMDLETLTHRVVAEALADAGLQGPLPECGVVVGSSRGQQGQWEQWLTERCRATQDQTDRSDHLKLALRDQWLAALPQAAAIATARQVQTQARVSAPMAACATGIWAIAQGMDLIRTGECQRVLAGAVEAPITPLTVVGFRQMGALAQTGAYPFDRQRQGLVLGEGGAVLVLESAALARQRGAKIYGRMLGAGLTADGHHRSAPEVLGSAAIAAVKGCLDRSGISATAIDYIHAHGTATELNDHNEAQLIHALFSSGVRVSSTKGATGHTIGASGAIGTALCLLALHHQRLPPTVGLHNPAFDLNWVRVPAIAPLSASSQVPLQAVITMSFGFGGQNAVLAMDRIDHFSGQSLGAPALTGRQ